MIDPELDELKREFLREAQEKVRQIEQALRSQESRESLETLAYLAHQLKGSGGSYGYQKISSEAAAIEKAVEENLSATDRREFQDTVQPHVKDLGAEIDRRYRELDGR